MNGHALTDAATMLRRSLRRMRRYPSMTFFVAGLPVILLLVFVYVLGGTLGAGLGGVGGVPSPGAVGGRDAYLPYVVPGILLLTVVGVGQGTAIAVAMDMTTGIVARFRTMAIARGAVLAGHVLGSVLQAVLAVALVMVVAVALGYRTSAAPAALLAAAGLLVLAAVAVAWISVALGLVTDSVETASNLPMILMLLLFLSSSFVPTASLPDPLRWVAENQPFTPIIETVRGLLLGTSVSDSAPIAVAWCVVVSVAGYAWARRLYDRVPARIAV